MSGPRPRRVWCRRCGGCLLAVIAAVAWAGCATRVAPRAYPSQERHFVVAAVPLLTRELVSTYPFLREDLAPGGVLEGKELYAFVPSTLTVVEGDLVRFTLLNPEDDEHDFVLPGLAVALPGRSRTEASWRAERAEVFDFVCTIPSHRPEMYGQIVVLPAAVGAAFAPPPAASR